MAATLTFSMVIDIGQAEALLPTDRRGITIKTNKNRTNKPSTKSGHLHGRWNLPRSLVFVMVATLPDRLRRQRHIDNIRYNSYRIQHLTELSNAIHPTAARAGSSNGHKPGNRGPWANSTPSGCVPLFVTFPVGIDTAGGSVFSVRRISDIIMVKTRIQSTRLTRGSES